jgi:hypothetical protein
MKPIERKRVEYSLADVTRHDALQLQAAAGTADKVWYCFGKSWYKMDALELVDDDLKPTVLGLAVARKILEN